MPQIWQFDKLRVGRQNKFFADIQAEQANLPVLPNLRTLLQPQLHNFGHQREERIILNMEFRRGLFYLLDYVTSTEFFQIGDGKKKGMVTFNEPTCAVSFQC